MFSDKFWSEDFVQKGRKALYFERETGYRVLPRGESTVPIRPCSHERDVTKGFLADKNGFLVRQVDKQLAKDKTLCLGQDFVPTVVPT